MSESGVLAQKLRKGVDYTGVAVAFLIVDPEFNLLVHKRGKKCRDERGTWDTGSGGVDFLEDPEEAAPREMEEEYGIPRSELTHPPLLLGVRSVVRPETEEDAESHWVIFVYLLRVGTVRRAVKIPEAESEKILTPMWLSPLNALILTLHSQVESHLGMWRATLSPQETRDLQDAARYERGTLATKYMASMDAETRSLWVQTGIQTGWSDRNAG